MSPQIVYHFQYECGVNGFIVSTLSAKRRNANPVHYYDSFYGFNPLNDSGEVGQVSPGFQNKMDSCQVLLAFDHREAEQVLQRSEIIQLLQGRMNENLPQHISPKSTGRIALQRRVSLLLRGADLPGNGAKSITGNHELCVWAAEFLLISHDSALFF